MKNLILIIALFFASIAFCNAQKGVEIKIKRDTTSTDTIVSCEIKEKRFKNVDTRWVMLDYGLSMYAHKGKLNLPTNYFPLEQKIWGSHNFDFHLVRQRVNLYKHKINVEYGLTFQFNKYNLSNDFVLEPNQTEVTLTESTTALKRNHFNSSYLVAPLLLDFKIGKKKSYMRFQTGGYAGFLLKGKRVTKTAEEGRVKVNDDYNLNKVRYGLTARLGYKDFTVYANYGLSSLFKTDENAGFDLNPLSIGISIIPF